MINPHTLLSEAKEGMCRFDDSSVRGQSVSLYKVLQTTSHCVKGPWGGGLLRVRTLDNLQSTKIEIQTTKGNLSSHVDTNVSP